jgi:hypothetical protein
MRADQIIARDAGHVSVTFHTSPIGLPEPLDRLVLAQLARRGQASYASKAAMFQLDGEIPTPILAELLGLAGHTAVRWAALAAHDWSQYTARRRQDGPELSAPDMGETTRTRSPAGRCVRAEYGST